MDQHSKHCLSSQVQVFTKFILNLKIWKSIEPKGGRSRIFHLSCQLLQSIGQSPGEIISGSHLTESSHGGARKEDHERPAQSISEEVVTVKLHQTKPTTTAVVVAVHELPCKPLNKLGSETWGSVTYPHIWRHPLPSHCGKLKNNIVQLQRYKI